MPPPQPLRIGFVPEHFSVPLHFATQHYGLSATLVPFPSGTGHMITAIREGAIDVAIGLTEAWIAGLGQEHVPGDGGYRIIGTYVTSPLRWDVSTGLDAPYADVSSLPGTRVGVSRLGSGSHIMATVLARQHSFPTPPFSEFVPLNDFATLRAAVNDGRAAFFMWEHFTTRAHDAKLAAETSSEPQLRRLGDIYTPWPSWMIVASTGTVGRARGALVDFLATLDRGVARFASQPDQVVSMCVKTLGYRDNDVREWLPTVSFSDRTANVRVDAVRACVKTLSEAGVLAEGKGMRADDMVIRLLDATN